jgi:uncharacterized protein YbaP (TraB family)
MNRIINWIIKRVIFLLLVQSLTLFFFVNILGFNLYSKEVLYEKNGKEVILLGISHIGDESYYKELSTRYLKKENLLVLTEGINVEDNSEELTHKHSAKLFGLVSQDSSFMKEYDFKNVDISFNEIDVKYLLIIEESFNAWEKLSLLNFKDLKNINIHKEDVGLVDMYNEIIIKRNVNIKKEILMNKTNNILVPWGAIHHIDLHNFLIKQGYKLKDTNFIKIANIFNMLINAGRHLCQ